VAGRSTIKRRCKSPNMADFLRSLDSELRVSVAACVLGLAASIGCHHAQPTGTSEVQPTYNKDSGRLERIDYDRNRDTRMDALLVMDGTRVIRAELDENFDGVVDRWEFYGDQTVPSAAKPGEGLVPRGTLVRAEQATRSDGKVNRRESYRNGQLSSVEEDANGDGRTDKWETWSGGALRVMALDTRGTGKPDRRLVYPPDGSPPRLEVDHGGSGRFVAASGS
jgi:hypothetical protein